jgi:hypothetical protein
VGRTIINKIFEVHCKCDRCGRENNRTSDGDISLPAGWAYLYVSTWASNHEGTLLCASCVPLVLTAAAPARLEI